LAVGCWLLAVGCWLLAVGCWLLAVGCWKIKIYFPTQVYYELLKSIKQIALSISIASRFLAMKF